jgi:hypothetical protein
MKFDHDILFEFLPEEDKKSFMVWDNVILSQKYTPIPDKPLSRNVLSVQTIVATYRSPFEERVLIPLDEYELRVKEKERNNKLNNLGIC